MVYRLLVLFLCAVLAKNSQGQLIHYDPLQEYPIKDLQTDLRSVRTALENRNQGLYRYTPKKQFDLFFDSLYKAIVRPQTSLEFYNLLTLLNSKIKNGHTMFLPDAGLIAYNNREGLLLPFYFNILKGKIYVRMNCSPDTIVKEGSEVLQINGLRSSDILHQLISRQIRDGNNQTYPTWILSNYFKEYYSYSFGHPHSFSIIFRSNGSSTAATSVPGLSKDSIRFYKKLKYGERNQSPAENQGIVLKVDKELRIGILTIKSFDVGLLQSVYKQDFKYTVEKIFIQIRDSHIRDLILDLRDNQGGDFESGRLLLRNLICYPIKYLEGSKEYARLTPKKYNFKGRLYVLINGGSFSNTAIVCSYLKSIHRGIFIGEETGGNKTVISGDPEEFILPKTKILTEISTVQYAIRKGFNDGHGVVPDYLIQPTIDDVISGKDKAMEKAVDMAKNNH